MLALVRVATSHESHSRHLVQMLHDVMIEKQQHVSVDSHDVAIQRGDLNLSVHSLVKATQHEQRRTVGQIVKDQ